MAFFWETRMASVTATILHGKPIAEEIRAEVAEEVRQIGGRPPGLTVILVGDDPASQVYARNKKAAAAEVGIAGQVVTLPADSTQDQVAGTILETNNDPAVDGILVQLPLPGHLGERPLLDLIDPVKDVDGFTTGNVGRLWLGAQAHRPATPSGIMQLLERSGIPVKGKQAVVVGRSAIVGKPMAAMLLEANATVTVTHSQTRDLAQVCRGGEILVAAVGVPALIGRDHIAPGAVVIDVGINPVSDQGLVQELYPGDDRRLSAIERRGATLVGDVDFEAAREVASAITPVPGGVGPLTIAMLLKNTVAARRMMET